MESQWRLDTRHMKSPMKTHREEIWDQYRETISRLYLDENKPLKVVEKIMLCRYGFNASARMYKTRIAKWGLDKNNKKPEIEAVLRIQAQRVAAGKKSVFELRGRPVDIKAIQRYQRRKGITTRDVMTPHVSHAAIPLTLRCTTPDRSDQTHVSSGIATPWAPSCTTQEIQDEPPPISLSHLPETSTPVEEILKAIRVYIVGSFETGAWLFDEQHPQCQDVRKACSSRLQDSKSKSADLYVLICQSGDFFRGGDYHHGGICLRKGFSRIQEILAEEDPFAVWELMNTVSFLREQGWNEILQFILCQLAEMSAVLKTPSHPLSRIFTWCRRLAISDLLQVLATMRRCAADQFELVTGALSVGTVKLKLGSLRAMSLILGREAIEATQRGLLAKYRAQLGPGQVQCLLVLNRLANSLYERGQYAETENIGHEILRHASSTKFKGCPSVFRGRGLSLMCRAQVAQGKYDNAEGNVRQLLDLNVACHGWDDPLTIDTMMVLETCLNGVGKTQDAARMRTQRLNHISEFDATVSP